MKLKTVFKSVLLMTLICTVAQADEQNKANDTKEVASNTQAQKVEVEQWINLMFDDNGIVEQKEEILLTPKQALEIFQKEPPKFKADWLEKLGRSVEPAANARKLPDTRKMPEETGKAFAYIAGFSKRFAQIMILEDKGSYGGRSLSSCQANFKIPRDEKIDAFFGLKELEQTYFFRHKGIGNGNRPREVFAVLGKPDGIQSFQIGGMLNYYYLKDDVTILIDDGIVSRVVPGIPEWVKREIKENGVNVFPRF